MRCRGEIDVWLSEEVILLPNKLLDELNKAKRRLPSETDEETRKKLERRISTSERLVNGDQFTIYIPSDYKPEKIANLCTNIHDELVKLNAVPGEFAVAESPLTPFISFRQDHVDGEYIEAADSQLKDSQEKSPIFLHLKEQLIQKYTPYSFNRSHPCLPAVDSRYFRLTRNFLCQSSQYWLYQFSSYTYFPILKPLKKNRCSPIYDI